jgi:diguanylate cyclase (GGDEF)-like protein
MEPAPLPPPVPSREEVLARLARSTGLPSLPAVALRIVELGQQPDVHVDAVTRAVSLDPALVTKVLRVANSPVYARQRRTQNLRQAILMLGLNGTLTLALTFSLASALRRASGDGLSHELLWRRSLAIAAACRALGARVGLAPAEDLFLIGLLQDVGMLALDRVVPELYRGLGAAQASHQAVCDRERAALGMDHADVGAWLLGAWNLPTRVQRAVAGSHDPERGGPADDTDLLPRCAAVAGGVADIWLREDREQAALEAADAAGRLLGVEGAVLGEVLEAVSAEIQETAPLFEVELRGREDMELVLEQAKETVLLRSLRVVDDSARLSALTESLVDRTRQLEEQARRDGLTGLYNRRYVDERLAEELRDARTHGWPLAVLFVDLDGFKRINDTHGHPAGDQVLRGAGRLLLEGTRGSDLVARFGGDELLLLLPGTGLAGAAVTADRIVDSFRQARHDVGHGLEVTVTASIGVAVLGEGQDFASAEELLRAADQAVYEAKRGGRDRWVAFGPGTRP